MRTAAVLQMPSAPTFLWPLLTLIQK